MREIVFMLLAGLASGMVLQNTMYTDLSWTYVGKFCFNPSAYGAQKGVFDFEVDYNIKFKNLAILFYYDGSKSFEKVWQAQKTCTEKFQVARQKRNDFVLSEMVNLPTGYANKSRAIGRINFATPVPRYFFVAFSNCAVRCDENEEFCDGPLQLSYKMSFFNGNSTFNSHFSADETGIYEINIFFFALQCCMCIFSICIARALMEKKKFHHTVKILIFAIYAHAFALMLKVIHCAQFASDGIGFSTLKVIAKCAFVVSELLLILLIILLAKGWTIVRRKITAQGRLKLGVYMAIYACAYVGAIAWSVVGFDPTKVSYFYDSPPGTVILVMRVEAFCWFSYAVFTTTNNYHSKKHFYGKFYIMYGLWLVSLPIVAFTSVNLPDYNRAKVIEGVELTLHALALGVLIVMYNPNTRFNKSFPFHAKTSDMKDVIVNGAGADAGGDAAAAAGVLSGTTTPVPGSLPGSGSPSKTLSRAQSITGASLTDLTGLNELGKAKHLATKIHDRLAVLQTYTSELTAVFSDFNDPVEENGADLAGPEKKKATALSFGKEDVDRARDLEMKRVNHEETRTRKNDGTDNIRRDSKLTDLMKATIPRDDDRSNSRMDVRDRGGDRDRDRDRERERERDKGGRSPEDRDRRRSVEKGEKAEDSSVADSSPAFNDSDNNKKKGANEKGWF